MARSCADRRGRCALLSLLCCPRCGGAFQISKADMDMSAIFSADLHCSCGYRAEILNGIVYAECEEKYPFDEPGH